MRPAEPIPRPLTETVTKAEAAMTVRPFGTAGHCVGGVIDLGSSSVRGGVGCEATSNIDVLLKTEFLKIAQAFEIDLYKGWPAGQ